MLKLVSLPVASGASLRLTLANASCLAPTDNEVMLYRLRKGGRNRERNYRIPSGFCTEAKVAKGGGVFAGHYSTSLVPGLGTRLSWYM